MNSTLVRPEDSEPVTLAFPPLRAVPTPDYPIQDIPAALVKLAGSLQTGLLVGLPEIPVVGMTLDADDRLPVALLVAPHDVALEWAERFASCERTLSYVDPHTGLAEHCFLAVVDGLRWEIRTLGWRPEVAAEYGPREPYGPAQVAPR